MAHLSVEHLSKTRAYDEIFSDVSFTLNSGQLLWLKGANGSGKTSLMRILAGLSAPNSGHIQTDIESLHYISHNVSLVDSLNVKETIELLYPLYGIDSATSDINSFLSLIAMSGTETLNVSQLSAGQRQRLNLLSLSLDKRPLWLLDEPYSNLDKAGRKWLDGLIEEHLSNAGLVVVISHGDSLGVEETQVLELDA